MASASPARIIYISTGESRAMKTLESSGLDYVFLAIPVKRAGLRRTLRQVVAVERVAEAVSAADDLAGELRISLDLTDDEAWERLAPRGERREDD